MKGVKRDQSEWPRNLDPSYWQSTWGQLTTKVAAFDGDPLIDSRNGKLLVGDLVCDTQSTVT